MLIPESFKWLIRNVLAIKVRLQEKLLPDPRQSAPEIARARGMIAGQHREPPMVKAAARPFHRLMGKETN